MNNAFTRLSALYAALDTELPAIGGQCTACGQCCDFARADHVLYASRLEIEYMKQSSMTPVWSRGPDVCPFLTDDNQCGAREHRALGCRTYFRIVRDKPGSEALYEKYLQKIKEVCLAEGIPWEYLQVLPELASQGRKATV